MQRHLLLKLLLHRAGHVRDRKRLDRTLNGATRLALALLRVECSYAGTDIFVPPISFRKFIVIHSVHERVEPSTTVQVRLNALTLLVMIDHHLAVFPLCTIGILSFDIFGKPDLGFDRSATAFPSKRHVHLIIINSHDLIDVHGDLFCLRPRLEKILDERIYGIVKLAG